MLTLLGVLLILATVCVALGGLFSPAGSDWVGCSALLVLSRSWVVSFVCVLLVNYAVFATFFLRSLVSTGGLSWL